MQHRQQSITRAFDKKPLVEQWYQATCGEIEEKGNLVSRGRRRIFIAVVKCEDSNCLRLVRKLLLRQLDPPCVCLASQPALCAGHIFPLCDRSGEKRGFVCR